MKKIWATGENPQIRCVNLTQISGWTPNYTLRGVAQVPPLPQIWVEVVTASSNTVQINKVEDKVIKATGLRLVHGRHSFGAQSHPNATALTGQGPAKSLLALPTPVSRTLPTDLQQHHVKPKNQTAKSCLNSWPTKLCYDEMVVVLSHRFGTARNVATDNQNTIYKKFLKLNRWVTTNK